MGTLRVYKTQFQNVFSVFKVFDFSVRKKLVSYGLGMLFIGILDLLAVGLIGILGVLAVTGVQSKQPSGLVDFVLRVFHLQNLSLQSQVAFMAITSIILLLLRTVLSIKLTKRMYKFLAISSTELSSSLLLKAFNLPMQKLENMGSQDFLYAISQGVNNISFGVLGVAIAMITDVGVLIFLGIGLLLINPPLALASLGTFSFLGYILSKLVGAKSRELGRRSSFLYVESSNLIDEIFLSYRTLLVKNQRSYMIKKVNLQRKELADVNAEIAFLPSISKYVIESGAIISAFIVSATQFILTDSSHAVAALALFMASGTRIAPAILRIQQGIIQLQGNIGAATPTIKLIDTVANIAPLSELLDQDESSLFKGTINIKNLVYGYANSKKFKLDISNLSVDQGSFTAIVGPSGSGKSTLVDLILGINPPSEGEILISGESPRRAVSLWPNAIAYVPQSIIEINGSILENVLFGYAPGAKSVEEVKQALTKAELQDLFLDVPNALESKVGKNGSKLSGGERQRLGISRALLGNPKLIIMDEATSSLDSQTESRISETLNKLKGSLTLLVVAHRLSTVKNADKIIYMDKGRIIAQGSFQEVKDQIPDFETSAKLLGL